MKIIQVLFFCAVGFVLDHEIYTQEVKEIGDCRDYADEEYCFKKLYDDFEGDTTEEIED